LLNIYQIFAWTLPEFGKILLTEWAQAAAFKEI